MDVAMLVLGLSLLPALVGCNGLGFEGLTSQSKPKITAHPESQTPKSGVISADDRAVLATIREKDAQGREHCVWTRNVDPQSPFHWHYPKLEAVLTQPAEHRPNLMQLLDDPDRNVAFNAAIALGHSGNSYARGVLSTAIRTPALPLPMRCAAAEALGFSIDPPKSPKESNVAVSLQKLIDEVGRYSPKSTASYVPELHEELLRGLARREDAADDERFLSALKSPRAEVRLEALKAWSASKRGKLPIEATDLRTDSDPRVRAAALTAIAAQKHPQALDYLQQGLTDLHFTVRQAAIGGLGALGGPEASAALKEQFQNRSDGIRSEVVLAFALMKDKQALLAAVGDTSWRVRLKAVEALAAFPDDATAAAIEKLLDDVSGEVQKAAIHALEAWPLERSGPILLAAMSKPAFSVRKAASQQLAQRWPPAAKYSVDAPADRRAQILQDLDVQFHSQFATAEQKSKESHASQNRKQPVSPKSLAEVETMLAAGDIEALIAYGPSLIDVLEAMRFERKRTLSEAVYREVLPKIRAEFITLDHFISPEAIERRSAARELQAIAAKQPFCRLAWDRLAGLMAAENDDMVWLSVLQAVANESSPEVITIIYAGMSHSSSEVRRRACVYLAAHPDRRHVPVLLPALEDPQLLVVCAAVEALAAGGMDDSTPLRRLLNSTSDEIQVAVATALTQLRDPAGKPALERLAYSNDPQIRARVARSMGEYPDPAFIPILIHLLNDKANVTHAALASLPQVVGEDQAKSANQPPASTAEQISRWKRWYDRQQGSIMNGRKTS
jgi:HEAT repeat protein